MRCLSIAAAAGALLVGACAGTGTAEEPPWRQTMRGVGDEFEIVEAELRKGAGGDLEAVARAARSAAALVRNGYGEHERKDVAGFAAMARACESWLLAIAMEADQGHGLLALDRLGTARCCSECHDRSGKRPW